MRSLAETPVAPMAYETPQLLPLRGLRNEALRILTFGPGVGSEAAPFLLKRVTPAPPSQTIPRAVTCRQP
jgi:hypothetical protein